MAFEATLTTERLVLQPLSADDNHFMLQLVNSEGWIKFIGDKKVYSADDATAYIKKINDNKNTTYWTVKLKAGASIGLITFIKRDYLEYHDIGFALLPDFANKGYAYEAAHAVLNYLSSVNAFTTILATTLPDNTNSIKLLKKLGLSFDKEIKPEETLLHVYRRS